MEEFIKRIIIEGREYIVKNKWEEWSRTIEQITNSSQNEEFIQEYLKELINILKDLDNKEIQDIIKNLNLKYRNLNTAYIKSIAEQVTKFSSKGPQFLIQFISTFIDISQQEENRLTNYINNMNKINKYINEGLNYEEAELMANKVLISASIDNNNARVIPYKSFYQGLTQDNKLILIIKLSEDIILSYIFLDQDNYFRYLFQDARRTIIPKLLITDKFDNIIDLKKSDDLVNFNNTLIPQEDLIKVYNESKKLYSNLNKEVLNNILNEIEQLQEINKKNPLVISEDLVSGSNDKIGKKRKI